MIPDKKIQLQLDAERRFLKGKNYVGYSCALPAQRYVTTSLDYSGLESTVDDPLTLMNSNRLELARLKVGLLATQVAGRQYVHTRVLEAINKDELAIANEIHGLGVGDYETARKLRMDSLRLSRERREEEVSFFRDTSRVDLVDAILEYKSISNRGEILNRM